MEDKNMNNQLAVKTVEMIASHFHERILVTTTIDNSIYIRINHIDRLRKRKYLSDLYGSGKTYEEACCNYILHAMNRNYLLRYKHKYYATTTIRNIIKKSKVLKDV